MRWLLVLAMVVLLGAPGVAGLDLPPPPSGYLWEQCTDIGGALLRPEDWSFRRLSSGGKLAYFITKSAWEPEQPFDVGLTFNVLFDVPSQSGLPPTAFAKRFVGRAAAVHQVERTWTNEMGPFKAEGIVYSGRGASRGFKFYNLVIANDKTGTAYLVIFEAPETSWESEWSVIEPTVKKMLIDDVY